MAAVCSDGNLSELDGILSRNYVENLFDLDEKMVDLDEIAAVEVEAVEVLNASCAHLA